MKKESSWPRRLIIVFFCCLGLLEGACGIKAPPRPPRSPELPQVKDLDAVVMEGGVQLSWSIPFGSEAVDSFNLYRSKPETTKEPCPSCPRAYELIRTVDVKVGQTYFQIFDLSIQAEGRYHYLVTPLDERDRLGPDSNETEVVIKWRQKHVTP
jgi:hypothetical protein